LRGKPIGQLLVWLLLVLTIASSLEAFVREIGATPHGWQFQRAHIGAQLAAKGGRHLVIVRYGPLHSVHREWVYNMASIDEAPVVWARELDPTQNRRLLEYFKDRQVWLVDVDEDQGLPRLTPYPPEQRLNPAGDLEIDAYLYSEGSPVCYEETLLQMVARNKEWVHRDRAMEGAVDYSGRAFGAGR
jgi:hypothetical protein